MEYEAFDFSFLEVLLVCPSFPQEFAVQVVKDSLSVVSGFPIYL